MNNRDSFYSQEKEFLPVNAVDNDNYVFYRLKKTGQIICEITLNLGLDGETIEINQISDTHFNLCLPEDLLDPELNGTFECRKWLAGGESTLSVQKAMDAARFADQIVVTGDILDFLTKGAAKLTVEHIIARSEYVVLTVGSHDYTKQMQTGLPDQTPLEERIACLQAFWPHDINYFSKTIKDKVIIVGLNNSQYCYTTEQVKKLKRDIEKAKSENKIILLFQHAPLSTGNIKDIDVKATWAFNKESYNFYNGGGICTHDSEMHRLICNNSDIIKGVFCGHLHSFFITYILANNNELIPQYVSTANPYRSHGIVTRIIVK